jgi:phytoene synthase
VNNNLASAYEFCRALTRREAKNFYFGFALLPDAQRRAIYAAYAFARRADDIVDSDLPRAEARDRLGVYRGKLDIALQGDPVGPVFTALSDTVSRFNVTPSLLYDLLDGCAMDLDRTHYESFEDVETYCRLVASSIGLISIEIFGYGGGDHARRAAADLGIALQLTNILRDVQEDGERGRVYLPKDEMEWFGWTERDLLAGRVNAEFCRFMALQADRAQAYFDSGRRLLPLLPARARACVGTMAGIYSSILDEIGRDPAVIFHRRVSPSTGHKLAVAGRELVRAAVG